MWRWLVVSLAMIAMLTSGCQQATEKAVEQATGAKTEQKGESVTISTKEGTAVTITSDTPDELKDFPVPDGFKSEGSGTMSAGGDDKLIAASWKGKGDVKAIWSKYKTAMADKGWNEDFGMDTDDGGMRNYSKGDYSATVTLSKEKGEEEITIAVLMGKGKKTPTPEATATEGPTETPEPTATEGPTSTPEPPEAADPSSLAPEMKSIPVPDGFSLTKDNLMRFEEDGQFKSAVAMWYGTTPIKDVAKFYKDSMEGKGWNETEWMEMDDVVVGSFTSTQDEQIKLTLSIGKGDGDTGTLITWMLAKD